MSDDATVLEFTATQEIIHNLKDVREKQNLSIAKIMEMVEATGAHISMTTLRRVFADGSEENDSFSYENTLRPIAQAILINYGLTSGDELRRARTETYEAIFRHKREIIENLRLQIETLKAEHEARCREYDKRLAFLRNQIEKKDQRMDRKDRIIENLMSRVLT